jgi:hypothetical protein
MENPEKTIETYRPKVLRPGIKKKTANKGKCIAAKISTLASG